IFGREELLRRIVELANQAGGASILVVGKAGYGKSRLAAETARSYLTTPDADISWIDLDGSPFDGHYYRAKSTGWSAPHLVLLDNFERAGSQATDGIRELRRRGLAVLAFSRHRVEEFEHTVTVGPLPVETAPCSSDRLHAAPAARLYLDILSRSTGRSEILPR